MSAIAQSQGGPSDEALIAAGERVVRTEADALSELAGRIGDNFAAACRLLLSCEGRIVVTGMGKSGHIARKIAATFASAGTPAFHVYKNGVSAM